jgi:hypothetical protein
MVISLTGGIDYCRIETPDDDGIEALQSTVSVWWSRLAYLWLAKYSLKA